MAGVAFTLGAQLLLALLLRVRAVRQALGAFNRWLYLTFGFSFRSLSHYETSSSSSSGAAVGSTSSPGAYAAEGHLEATALERSSSSSSTASCSSSSSSSSSAYSAPDGRKLSRKGERQDTHEGGRIVGQHQARCRGGLSSSPVWVSHR